MTDNKPKRTRKNTGPRQLTSNNPEVQVIEMDGRAVAKVALGGRHANGRSMLLDLEDWHSVSAKLGGGWLLLPLGPPKPDGSRYVMVASGRSVVMRHARRGSAPVRSLARLLLRATPCRHVVYLNGDQTDLRRVNLKLKLVHRRKTKKVSAKVPAAMRPPLSSFWQPEAPPLVIAECSLDVLLPTTINQEVG